MKIIDISQPLLEANTYPGDIKPKHEFVNQIPNDTYNLSELYFNVHNGTHIDAPKHYFNNGLGVGSLPLDIFYGPVTVIDTINNLDEILKNSKERLLIKGNLEINESTATKIAQSHIKLLGVESQCVGPIDFPDQVHKILLSKNIVLLEGLVLKDVEPSNYELIAFPLNLGEIDGSPVRAVLISNK